MRTQSDYEDKGQDYFTRLKIPELSILYTALSITLRFVVANRGK